jgi:hypothetical protein
MSFEKPNINSLHSTKVPFNPQHLKQEAQPNPGCASCLKIITLNAFNSRFS